MDEVEETQVASVGEKLRAAREDKKLSLEDIAAQTRIPRRHLESLEMGDWDKLPAPTYTIGFARSYATAVGLDRTEISDQLRGEMGGRSPTATAEIFEPADPARTMPKSLVFGAIGAIIVLVVLMSWLSNRSLEAPETEVAAQPADSPSSRTAAPATAAPRPQQAAQGPVVLTATGPAWVQVTDQGRKLFEGEMAPGQTYTVPATATAPLLRVGAPQALRITVGSAVVPPVGPAGEVTSNVSLLPADLMRGGTTAPSPAAPAGNVAG